MSGFVAGRKVWSCNPTNRRVASCTSTAGWDMPLRCKRLVASGASGEGGSALSLSHDAQACGDLILEFQTGFEFYCRASRYLDGFAWLLRIAADFCFCFANLEGSEIAHHHLVSIGQRIGNDDDKALDDFQHILLGECVSFGAELIGDFDGQFSFGDGGHGL